MFPKTKTKTVFRFLPENENIVFSGANLMYSWYTSTENFEFSNQLINLIIIITSIFLL